MPNEVMPDAVVAGSSNRVTYSSFSVGRHDVEPRASAQFAEDRLRDAGQSNNGNTIETSRADRPDESNLCVAIRSTVVTR